MGMDIICFIGNILYRFEYSSRRYTRLYRWAVIFNCLYCIFAAVAINHANNPEFRFRTLNHRY